MLCFVRKERNTHYEENDFFKKKRRTSTDKEENRNLALEEKSTGRSVQVEEEDCFDYL